MRKRWKLKEVRGNRQGEATKEIKCHEGGGSIQKRLRKDNLSKQVHKLFILHLQNKHLCGHFLSFQEQNIVRPLQIHPSIDLLLL